MTRVICSPDENMIEETLFKMEEDDKIDYRKKVSREIELHSSIDFKSNLRLMTILIFTTLQIPFQYYYVYYKYPIPEGAPPWIKHTIMVSSVVFLFLEILEYRKWNYRFTDRKIPFTLFMIRAALLGGILLIGKYSFDHSILTLFFILIVFYTYEAFAFPIGLIISIILSVMFVIPGFIQFTQSDSQYLIVFTIYRSLIMILFYLFAYFWNKDREHSDQNRKLLKELNISDQNLREYARRVGQTAALEERTRLARDIHDSVGHALTAIQIQLSKAEAYFERNQNESRKAVQEAKATAQDAMADVRESLNMLNSDKNINFSVEAEITTLLESLKRAGYRASCQIKGDYKSYNYAVLITLFRFVQEGITNILKHAGPCEVLLRIDFGKEHLTCLLEDKGKGFDPAQQVGKSHFGLEGLKNRVTLVRGTFELDSAPGRGCCLKTVLPKDPVNFIGYEP